MYKVLLVDDEALIREANLSYLDTIEITRSGENACLSHGGALNCNFGFGITKKIYSYYEYIRRCFFW